MHYPPDFQPKENRKEKFLAACIVLGVIYIGFSFAMHALADPPTSPYIPGETLNPTCAPTDPNCTVLPPLFATTTLPVGGILFENDASGTITANTSTLYWNAAQSMLQVGSVPLQTATSTDLLLGPKNLVGGNPSGTFIGINQTTSSTGADFMNFEGSSSIIFNVGPAGDLEIGTGTQASNSALLTVGSSSVIFAAFSNGVVNAGGSFNASGTITQNGVSVGFGTVVTSTAGVSGFLPIWTSGSALADSWAAQNGNSFVIASGTLLASNSTSSSYFQLGSSSIEKGNASGTWFGINASTGFNGDFLDFEINSSTKFLVNGSGSVEIGTGTPSVANALLTVASASNIFAVLNNGNVGVGVANPTSTLQVAGSINATSFTGGGLTTCVGTYSRLLWSSSTNQFSCTSSSSIPAIQTNSTNTVITATANVTSTLTLNTSITPSNSSSAVLVTYNLLFKTTTANVSGTLEIFRGTNGTTTDALIATTTLSSFGTVNLAIPLSVTYVDQPTTTNLQTYSFFVRANASALTIQKQTVVLQEVKIGSDLAEIYPTNDAGVQPGDLVSLDSQNPEFVTRTSGDYDPDVIGVISTQPSIVMGTDNMASGDAALVALSGRVPVNVDMENGPISPGDYIAPSSIPGVGMRAIQPGRVIGIALAAAAGDGNASDTTQVLVFVNPGWSLGSLTNPADIASSSWALEQDSGGQFVIDQFTAYVQAALAKLGVVISNGIATLQGIVANTVTTNELCVQGTCVNGSQLSNLLNNSGAANSSTTTEQAPSPPDATDSSSTTTEATTTPDDTDVSSSTISSSTVTTSDDANASSSVGQ